MVLRIFTMFYYHGVSDFRTSIFYSFSTGLFLLRYQSTTKFSSIIFCAFSTFNFLLKYLINHLINSNYYAKYLDASFISPLLPLQSMNTRKFMPLSQNTPLLYKVYATFPCPIRTYVQVNLQRQFSTTSLIDTRTPIAVQYH